MALLQAFYRNSCLSKQYISSIVLCRGWFDYLAAWAPELLLFLCGISEFGCSVLNLYFLTCWTPGLQYLKRSLPVLGFDDVV